MDLDACCLHATQLVLELADLVADPGGYLELQLRRRRVHLLGELRDQRGMRHLALLGERGV